MHGNAIDATTMQLVEGLLPFGGTDVDAFLVGRMQRAVRAGDQRVVDLIAALDTPRRPEAGDFGLDGITGLWTALVLPAVYAFVKAFAKKLPEAIAEQAADKGIETLADRVRDALRSETAPAGREQATWSELERAFATRARELGLSESSYRTLLDAARAQPAMLLPRAKDASKQA